jgi:hypothetical protein
MNQIIIDRPIAELAREIREMCGDDEQAFVDTLDGETDTIEAARKVVRLLKETEANEAAAKSLATTYGARAKLFADRGDRMRGALLNFMQEIGVKTLPLPEATLSVGAGQRKVVGQCDPNDLPDELVRVKREADLAAIKLALENGDDVFGYSLSNATPRLTVRLK